MHPTSVWRAQTDAMAAASLITLRSLDPGVVMSSGFVSDIAYREVTLYEWHAAIDNELINIGQNLF